MGNPEAIDKGVLCARQIEDGLLWALLDRYYNLSAHEAARTRGLKWIYCEPFELMVDSDDDDDDDEEQ